PISYLALAEVVTLTGSPSVSKPQVRLRSCSIFCSARIWVKVPLRAMLFERVAMANSCASDVSATARIVAATITSTSEKPAESELLNLYFANAIHHDVFG